jgi:hypothetical protein
VFPKARLSITPSLKRWIIHHLRAGHELGQFLPTRLVVDSNFAPLTLRNAKLVDPSSWIEEWRELTAKATSHY